MSLGAVEDDVEAVARGEVSFKGIQAPIEVYCVIGAKRA